VRLISIAVPSLVVAALALSGCSFLGPKPKAFADLDGNGSISAGEKALQSYRATVAGASGSPATLTDAKAQGVEGFEAGTLGTVAAADPTGRFATAKIQTTSSGLKVTVDGTTFTMPVGQAPMSQTINGHVFQVALYGQLDGNYVPSGNTAVTLEIDDASLTMFIKNYQAAYDAGQNVTNYTYDGYAIIATGRETSTDHLPTVIAQYKGGWFLISGANSANSGSVGGSSGQFTATVDFNAKTLAAVVQDFSNSTVATATAKISGNKFIGTATGSNFNGEIIGGFYGPNAEQIAGVGHGLSSSENAELGFIGTQSP
jgi:hypothetical protein